MKELKIKRYRLGVSRYFPKTHPKAGQVTLFPDKIMLGMGYVYTNEEIDNNEAWFTKKIHTIRSNYQLWAKRMEKVRAGNAVIELFYWEDKPYRSKQVVFAILDKDSGCGVVELKFVFNDINWPWLYSEKIAAGNLKDADFKTKTLAKNDGLSLEDFKAWFKGYDLSKPMAIIHFTSFRY